jgi:hypothetical protein
MIVSFKRKVIPVNLIYHNFLLMNIGGVFSLGLGLRFYEFSVLPLAVSTGQRPSHHSAKKPPDLLSLRSFESDHEIMQNGIICLNLVEKNVGNPAILGRTCDLPW